MARKHDPDTVETTETETGRKRLTPAQRFRALRVNGGNGTRANEEVKQYRTVGAPPEDPLKAQEWAFELMTISMFHVATDASLNEKERRRELRETARVLKDMVPANRLSKAERRVMGETAKQLGEDAGPQLEAAPPLAKKSRRGRPPKRG